MRNWIRFFTGRGYFVAPSPFVGGGHQIGMQLGAMGPR